MIQYTDDGSGVKRAIITVYFLSEEGNWLPLDMQIDTAADISVIPYDFASKLLFLGEQMPIYVREVVGSMSGVKTTVRAKILGKELNLPIIASGFVAEPLLGVAGFLDNFIVTFYPNGFEVKPI